MVTSYLLLCPPYSTLPLASLFPLLFFLLISFPHFFQFTLISFSFPPLLFPLTSLYLSVSSHFTPLLSSSSSSFTLLLSLWLVSSSLLFPVSFIFPYTPLFPYILPLPSCFLVLISTFLCQSPVLLSCDFPSFAFSSCLFPSSPFFSLFISFLFFLFFHSPPFPLWCLAPSLSLSLSLHVWGGLRWRRRRREKPRQLWMCVY